MQRRHQRQRDDRTEQSCDREWKDSAERNTNYPADNSNKHDLSQINRKDAPAAGTERLHGGDCLAPSVEMTFDCVAHADAADQKRGETDDGKELGEAFDIALKLRRGI